MAKCTKMKELIHAIYTKRVLTFRREIVKIRPITGEAR